MGLEVISAQTYSLIRCGFFSFENYGYDKSNLSMKIFVMVSVGNASLRCFQWALATLFEQVHEILVLLIVLSSKCSE